jgi:hypothetical protein
VKKALLALALLLALPAAAQSPVIVSKESPRWGSFQISLSPFSPNIDSEFIRTATSPPPPYATTFGTGRPLMVQAIFSKSAWLTEVGTLDVGFGAGYWQVWGVGYYQSSTGQIQRGGSTNLMIIPLQLEATYRVDWFYERFEIPLAPYVRGALVDYIWTANGQGGVSTFTDPSTGTVFRGSGATFGWSATLGLALVLDYLDNSLSKQMDYDTGINRTMLFIDFTRSSVNDFGSTKSWQLAPGFWAWSAGLLFVF